MIPRQLELLPATDVLFESVVGLSISDDLFRIEFQLYEMSNRFVTEHYSNLHSATDHTRIRACIVSISLIAYCPSTADPVSPQKQALPP